MLLAAAKSAPCVDECRGPVFVLAAPDLVFRPVARGCVLIPHGIIALRHGRLKVPLLTLVKATNRVPLQFLDRRF